MPLGRWIDRFDVFLWISVLSFFLLFSFFRKGDILLTIFSSLGIIFLMLIIAVSIEIIIDILQSVRGIGTVLGFITNGPEAVVLVVGMFARDVMFGVSTPLGSTVINPFMIVIAALIAGISPKLLGTKFGVFSILFTVGLSVVFYFLGEEYYLFWALTALIGTVFFFLLRPEESVRDEGKAEFHRYFLWLAVGALIVSGYYLDPVVELAKESSGVPKGVIGFLVLALLSSFPELKSFLSLFKKGYLRAAIINVLISNVTNIWLAVFGVMAYVFFYP